MRKHPIATCQRKASEGFTMTKSTTSTKFGTRACWRAHGERLRIARMVLAISEQEAAATCGVTLPTYQKWEQGARQRSAQGILAFCKKYGVYIDWLMLGRTISA